MPAFPLAFAFPWVLLALIGLPILYYLLQVTPPPPQVEPLPTLPLVRDLIVKQRQPAHTPWWLLLLRMLLVALGILALAGPRWNPDAGALANGQGPLVLLVDNGWTTAFDWPERRTRALAILENAANRPVALRATTDLPVDIIPGTHMAAIERLRSLLPAPHLPDRSRTLAVISAYMQKTPDANVIWLSDATATEDKAADIKTFLKDMGDRLVIVQAEQSPVRAIANASNERDAMVVTLARPAVSQRTEIGMVRALDAKGHLLGDGMFDFKGQTAGDARITLPLELRNDVSRLEIADAQSAGAVRLLDAGTQRKRVIIVSGENADIAQPLVSGTYFVTKALSPYANLSEAPRGVGDMLQRALSDRPDVLVLVDIVTLSGAALEATAKFVENGGVLIRFAGSGLATSGDRLLPVRLRRGGRVLGGTLSWDKPQHLAPFPQSSPFAGLPASTDIQIERQVLAEPEPELNDRTWAALQDGTPLVTALRNGKGLSVLFHVTADTAWSNLPLSGTFVEMLRRSIAFAVTANEQPDGSIDMVNPRRTLDGFGTFTSPPPTAKPIARNRTGVANADNPPGFYGPPEASVALNAFGPETALLPMATETTALSSLSIAPPLDLRLPALTAVFLLFLLDALAVLWLNGFFRRGHRIVAGAATLLLLLGPLTMPSGEARAQARPAQEKPLPQMRKVDIDASLETRLAYVLTGDKAIDETSRQGLIGLGQSLAARTSFEPAEPVGLDPAKDELVFYPLIYWPITANAKQPDEAALRRIDQFMRNGGTVIFDTRDALSFRPSQAPSPETRRLRAMLATLDIPDLEPVPSDHVLTKSFFLLDRMVGRYTAGETWIEALPKSTAQEKRPARAGDRVSPIIITSNDLAAAWAVDDTGQPRFAMVPGEPRQREMALRTGINLVMYAITGNYKADQVHIPALLERLGQ